MSASSSDPIEGAIGYILMRIGALQEMVKSLRGLQHEHAAAGEPLLPKPRKERRTEPVSLDPADAPLDQAMAPRGGRRKSRGEPRESGPLATAIRHARTFTKAFTAQDVRQSLIRAGLRDIGKSSAVNTALARMVELGELTTAGANRYRIYTPLAAVPTGTPPVVLTAPSGPLPAKEASYRGFRAQIEQEIKAKKGGADV
jgi:hypothetical protein